MRKSADGHCNFKVDILGREYRKCCGDAWRLAYGVPRNTFLRQLGGTPVKVSNKQKFDMPSIPDLADCSIVSFTNNEIQFIKWLQKCAQEVACKMPFGEGDETQLRLPYPSKKTVHYLFKNVLLFDNCTNLTTPLSYQDCCRVWKACPDLAHIKMCKHKEGFSKCDLCKAYERAISGNLSLAAREKWDLNFFKHIAETKKERAQYYKTKVKACIVKNFCAAVVLSIIIDAMDQRKTTFPYFSRPDKCIANEYGLKTKLFAAIVHSVGTFLFWSTPQIQGGSNLIIEVLRRTLLKIQEE